MPDINGPHYASRDYREGKTETKETKPESATGSQFPVSVGGGWYELSNGEKVQGQEYAEAEEAKLS